MTPLLPGQLVMVDIPGKSLDAETAEFLRAHAIRAVCLFRKNLGSESAIRQLTAALRTVMGEGALIGIDQEGGSVIRATSLPQAPAAMALGAIGDADFRNANLNQRRHNSAGGSTSTKNRRGTGCWIPVGGVLPQVRNEASAVGIVSVNAAIFAEDEGVGGADQSCPVGHNVGNLQDCFFMRNGDIDAHEAKFG